MDKYYCVGCGGRYPSVFLYMDNDGTFKYAHQECVSAAVKKLLHVPELLRKHDDSHRDEPKNP